MSEYSLSKRDSHIPIEVVQEGRSCYGSTDSPGTSPTLDSRRRVKSCASSSTCPPPTSSVISDDVSSSVCPVSSISIFGYEFTTGIPSNSNQSKGKYKRGIKTSQELLATLNEFSVEKFVVSDVSSGEIICWKSHVRSPFLKVRYDNYSQGVWLFPSIVNEKKTGGLPKTTNVTNIQQVITGSCMFGDHLLGTNGDGYVTTIDRNFGKLDPLINAENLVVEILEPESRLHAYEICNFTQLKLMLPLIKSLASQENPLTIHYNLPVPEYICGAFQWFNEGKITINALQQYIQLVVARGETHKEELDKIFSCEEGIVIGPSFSALDCLKLHDLAKVSVGELLNYVNAFTLESAIETLREENVQWKNYMNAYLKLSPNGAVDDIDTWLKLGYASYVVYCATHANNDIANSIPTAANTAILDEYREFQICLRYQRLFPTSNALLGMHWFPVCVPPKGDWYHPGSQEPALKALLQNNILEKVGVMSNIGISVFHFHQDSATTNIYNNVKFNTL